MSPLLQSYSTVHTYHGLPSYIFSMRLPLSLTLMAMTAAQPILNRRDTAAAEGVSSSKPGQNSNALIEVAKTAGQVVQWGLTAYGGYHVYRDLRKKVFPSQPTDTTQPPTEWLLQTSKSLMEEATGKNRQPEIQFRDPEQVFSSNELFQYVLCYQREKVRPPTPSTLSANSPLTLLFFSTHTQKAIGKSWKQNRLRNETLCRIVCYDEIMGRRKAKQSPPSTQPNPKTGASEQERQQRGRRGGGSGEEDYNESSAEAGIGRARTGRAANDDDSLRQRVGSAIRRLGGVFSSGDRGRPASSEDVIKDPRMGTGLFTVPKMRLPVFAG